MNYTKTWTNRITKEIEENGKIPRLPGNSRIQHPTHHYLQETNTLSNYLTKRLTILLQSLPYEPWRGEHNLFATHTTPCIWRTSETVAGLLRAYNIRVAHKPMFSLRRLVTNVTNKDKPEHRPGAVIRPNAPTAGQLNRADTGQATKRAQTSFWKRRPKQLHRQTPLINKPHSQLLRA